MKNDSTTTFLNFVLAALVILGVLFALMTIWRTRDFRRLDPSVRIEMQRVQNDFLRVQALLNDTITYNNTAKSPEITQILQSLQPPQSAAK